RRPSHRPPQAQRRLPRPRAAHRHRDRQREQRRAAVRGTANGTWYELRIRSYKDHDNRIDGAVLTLSDIAEAKERERELVYSRRLAEAVLQAAAQPLALIGDDLKLRALNSAFAALLGLRGEDGVGRRFDEVAPGKWDAEGLRELQVKRARGRA